MSNSSHQQLHFKKEIVPLLQSLLRKLFDIHEGEGLRACLMLLYIFLVISSLMIVKPVATSLFLSQFGVAHLPNAFILVAIFAAAVSSVYSKILHRVRLTKIIRMTLTVSVLSLLVFRVFLFLNYIEGWILYIFYVWVAIFAVISASQFWILANLLFNAREAKRLFGFIGSGAIAGGIFGGYLTNFMAPIIGSENLIFISVGFLLLCIPITILVWKRTSHGDQSYQFQQQRKVGATEAKPFRLIKQSRHLAYLASIVGVGVFVGKLVEYQFSAVASSNIPDEDQLTAFFGFWLSNLNILSLIIQLFFTRRVVGVFGVGTSLFFLPIGILLGAIAILIYPSLITAITLKISDGSLKNSINKAGIELLALPIPVAIKNQAKIFIDVFVDSFATGIGGIVLIALTLGLNFSVQHISIILIVLIVGWIYLVRNVQNEYLQSFRLQLEPSTTSKTPPQKIDLEKESVFGGLLKALEGNDEKQILSVLSMTKEVQNPKLIPAFKKLLHHSSPEVRLAILENIYFYKTSEFVEDAKALLIHDPDQNIKTEAMEYLYQRADNPISMLTKYFNHKDYRLRAAALLCAANESRKNQALKDMIDISTKVEKQVKQIPHLKKTELAEFTKINSAQVIGAANIPELYPYLHIFLNSRSKQVLKAAIAGAARTGQAEFIEPIIQHLGTTGLGNSVVQSLVQFGLETINVLALYLQNFEIERSIRLRIPKAIAAFGVQKSADVLIANLDQTDLAIRYEVIKALNRLRVKYPHVKIDQQKILSRVIDETKNYMDTLAVLYSQANHAKKKNTSDEGKSVKNAREELINALEHRLDQNLERIFRLLGLKYPPDDIYNAYLGIQKNNPPELRSNAVEFLDNLLEPDLKKIIVPIVETTLVDALIDDILDKFGLEIPGEFECFIQLLHGSDNALKISTLKLISALRDEKYIPFIGALIDNPNREIKNMAKFALTEIGIYEKKDKGGIAAKPGRKNRVKKSN